MLTLDKITLKKQTRGKSKNETLRTLPTLSLKQLGSIRGNDW